MKPKRKSLDLFDVIAQQAKDIRALQAALARINIVTIKTTTGDEADWGSFNHWQAGELSAAGPGPVTGGFDYWQAGEVHPFITRGPSGYEGQVVINTVDHTIKQYAEGAWRLLVDYG